MQRFEVCQQCLDLFERPRYLEIGVNEGATFHQIKAERKVAVDPDFLFDFEAAERNDPSSCYYLVESDLYFKEIACGLFDVIFLDGLHTYEQTLRDLLNSLSFIEADSVIIIDDVIPSGHGAAISDFATHHRLRAALSDPEMAWMGDVYRLVYFIAAFMPMWSYATVSENHGQLVLWRRPRDTTPMSVETTARVSFADLTLDKSVFNIMSFEAILERVKTERPRRGMTGGRSSEPSRSSESQAPRPADDAEREALADQVVRGA